MAKRTTRPNSRSPDRPARSNAPRSNEQIPRPRGRDLLVECPEEAFRGADELVAVATLGKAWGIRGDSTVRPHNPDSELSWIDDVVWLHGEGFPTRPVEVAAWQDKGGKLLARFEGIHTPQDASSLTHLQLLVPAEWLPEADQDEHYVHNLIGLQVVDEIRGPLGAIADVFATGAHDVWVVKGPAGEELIPAVRQFVLEVNEEEGVIRVRYEVED
jgi:16S rRNA processing protein RimM